MEISHQVLEISGQLVHQVLEISHQVLEISGEVLVHQVLEISHQVLEISDQLVHQVLAIDNSLVRLTSKSDRLRVIRLLPKAESTGLRASWNRPQAPAPPGAWVPGPRAS